MKICADPENSEGAKFCALVLEMELLQISCEMQHKSPTSWGENINSDNTY